VPRTKRSFKRLLEKKDEIERAFGEKLDWVNSLHHKIMDLSAFLEGNLVQRFPYKFRQLEV
jgi:hypothetical protein